MSIISRSPRTIVVGAVCALSAAAVATIADASASTTHDRAASAAHVEHRGTLRRLERRTVHAVLTVHTKAGFETVTVNRGTVDSVSGNTLTMTDSTRHAAGERVTLTIPAAAKVRNDRKAAALSTLTAGERVLVVALPNRTVVRAHPASAL